MRMLVLGGGPGGLYAALLTKLRNPLADVLVIERNRRDSTFGWGVVLSDQTVTNLRVADPNSATVLSKALHHWDDIDVHFRGKVIRSSGHGFSGIGRRKLLTILQQRCAGLGVQMHFEREEDDVVAVANEYQADIVIAADGINSRTRERWAASFTPDTETRLCRFIWLGTPRLFEAFTFIFEPTEFGWVQAHAYRFDESTSTFIVEMPEYVYGAHGLHAFNTEQTLAWCEQRFASTLQGQPLLSNTAHPRGPAAWIQFPRITTTKWTHWLDLQHGRVPVVLLGDAAHSAHFSIGSGTKLALEDAIELDHSIAVSAGKLRPALDRYQAVRSVETLKLQNAARNSTEWFENVSRYSTLDAEQFAYSLLTRSQRISHEGLRLRDPGYIAAFERWFGSQRPVPVDAIPRAHAAPNASLASPAPRLAPNEPPSGADIVPRLDTTTALPVAPRAAPPMFTPYTSRGVTLPNRVVVSPMAQYSAREDGTPSDWHLVHLGARAAGGAGLVFTEMICVAADARITPWCPGLWNETHGQAWQRIVHFVHQFTQAKIGLQLGHAGAKGATKKMWDGMDQPLETGAWPLIAPSETRYLAGISQVAREMTPGDMQRVRNEFANSTALAARSGFDWLELHCAHGYLLSAFLSPLTNRRADTYGGSLENRLRFPLEVFRAVRAEWPADKPVSIRISAHDWAADGNTGDDAVEIARAFRDAGADMIDVSAGQVVEHEQPVFGRMWQTPFADRIRQEAGIPTIAVGAVTDADQLNSILAAGRADLVAVARPHLVNPAWTLSEALRLGFDGASWPVQYLPGKAQQERIVARDRAAAQMSGAIERGELT